MASAASAKIEVDGDESSPGYASVPSLCVAATLKYGKPDALNHKIGGEWVNFSAALARAPGFARARLGETPTRGAGR